MNCLHCARGNPVEKPSPKTRHKGQPVVYQEHGAPVRQNFGDPRILYGFNFMRVRHVEQALVGLRIGPGHQGPLNCVAVNVDRVRRLPWGGSAEEARRIPRGIMQIAGRFDQRPV